MDYGGDIGGGGFPGGGFAPPHRRIQYRHRNPRNIGRTMPGSGQVDFGQGLAGALAGMGGAGGGGSLGPLGFDHQMPLAATPGLSGGGGGIGRMPPGPPPGPGPIPLRRPSLATGLRRLPRPAFKHPLSPPPIF